MLVVVALRSSSVILLSAAVSHSILTLVHLLVGLLVVLDDAKKLLEHLSKMWLGRQVVPLESSSLRSLILLPISLVFGLFHLQLSDLLDLVVVDDKHLALTVVILQVLLGLGGIGWLLVADEGEGIACSALLESDVLNLTVVLEEVGQILLGPLVGEVLYIQVASLLRCLVSDGLSDLLDLTLCFLEGV